MTEKLGRNGTKSLFPKLSSEEAEGEDGESVFVKPLPRRAKIVNEFFAQFDTTIMEIKSAQAKRQCKQRVVSTTLSTRGALSGLPQWAINQ